jgi:hypothetical protein
VNGYANYIVCLYSLIIIFITMESKPEQKKRQKEQVEEQQARWLEA